MRDQERAEKLERLLELVRSLMNDLDPVQENMYGMLKGAVLTGMAIEDINYSKAANYFAAYEGVMIFAKEADPLLDELNR